MDDVMEEMFEEKFEAMMDECADVFGQEDEYVTIDIPFPETCAECEIGKLRRRNLSDGICSLTGMGKPKGRRSIACPLRMITVQRTSTHQ